MIKSFSLLATVVTALPSPGVCAEPAPGLQQPRVVLQWGHKGSNPGEFYSPICIAVSAADEVFVADVNNARVQQFTTEGKFVAAFDLPVDKQPRKSCQVGGLAIDSTGNLYLAFMIQHKIAVYSKTGKLLRQWGKLGTGNGEFNQPGGIVIRSDGTIVVNDQCNHRVQVFTKDGQFLRKWGEHGAKPGQFGGPDRAGSRFGGPHFLTQDHRGRLYTTEGFLGRIQQFSADGQPLLAWGDKKKEPGAFGEHQMPNLGSVGPIGVFADAKDRIWVTSLNHRLQGFTPDGKLLYRLDGIGPDDPFSHPHGMAADSKGFLYLADSGNQRIVKLEVP